MGDSIEDFSMFLSHFQQHASRGQQVPRSHSSSDFPAPPTPQQHPQPLTPRPPIAQFPMPQLFQRTHEMGHEYMASPQVLAPFTPQPAFTPQSALEHPEHGTCVTDAPRHVHSLARHCRDAGAPSPAHVPLGLVQHHDERALPLPATTTAEGAAQSTRARQ